ncbi:MAG: hypothetical protein ABII00_04350 [Elusimicrobiota bacterium]
MTIPPTASAAVLPFAPPREDGSSMALNPGALSREPRRMLNAAYSPYLLGSQLSFMGYSHPLSWGVIGASLLRLGIEDIEGRADDRTRTGGFRAEDDAVGIAFSRSGLGAHLKFVRQKIDRYSAQGAALDLGYHTRLGDRFPLVVGLSVRNLGTKMRFLDHSFSLPTTLNVSAFYTVMDAIAVGGGLSRDVNEGTTGFSLGTQYVVGDALFLRAGYGLASDQRPFELPVPAAGFGVALGEHSIDYAFSPFRDLGHVHRFSVALRY